MRLKINEAIEKAANNGYKVKKIDIAKKIFRTKNQRALSANMWNLCSGRTKRITGEQVLTIAKMCHVSVSFLFGKEGEK